MAAEEDDNPPMGPAIFRMFSMVTMGQLWPTVRLALGKPTHSLTNSPPEEALLLLKVESKIWTSFKKFSVISIKIRKQY